MIATLAPATTSQAVWTGQKADLCTDTYRIRSCFGGCLDAPSVLYSAGRLPDVAPSSDLTLTRSVWPLHSTDIRPQATFRSCRSASAIPPADLAEEL